MVRYYSPVVLQYPGSVVNLLRYVDSIHQSQLLPGVPDYAVLHDPHQVGSESCPVPPAVLHSQHGRTPIPIIATAEVRIHYQSRQTNELSRWAILSGSSVCTYELLHSSNITIHIPLKYSAVNARSSIDSNCRPMIGI